MDDFKAAGHKDLYFWVQKGTVIESNENSETTISGGGTYVTFGGGVGQNAIRSKTVNKQSIWIKKEDGTEKKINLQGASQIDVRSGHEVSLIYCRPKDEELGYLSVVINRTTGNYTVTSNAQRLNNLLKPFKSREEFAIIVIVCSILFFLVGGVLAWFGDLFGLIESSEGLAIGDPGYSESYVIPSSLFLFYRFIRWAYLTKVFERKLNERLHKLAKSEL